MASQCAVRCLVAVLTVAALAAPAAAGDDTIRSGADLWKSFQGESHTDFSGDPLPAGFFCPGSPAFDGTVVMKGSPLATEPAGVLGEIDTIVHRLDDAAFDAEGVATTRIQMMALSMAGVEPLEVGCATRYAVSASLDGEQPTTEMRIVRENEAGGTFAAPLHMNVKLVFAPVSGEGAALSVRREILLAPAPDSYWTTTAQVGTDTYGRPVRVDTDGDRVADAVLPEALPFATGVAFAAVAPVPACPAGYCPSQCCHCTPLTSSPPPTWKTSGATCPHLHCVNCCKPCIVVSEEEPVERF